MDEAVEDLNVQSILGFSATVHHESWFMRGFHVLQDDERPLVLKTLTQPQALSFTHTSVKGVDQLFLSVFLCKCSK